MPKIEVEVTEQALKKLKGTSDSPVKIAILQRGWVFVGRFIKDGSDCALMNASCIRVWGTTRGIGELVAGPTSATVLEVAGTVRFHELAVVALLDCDESGWRKLC
jgi:hypothetical protein